MKNEITEYTNQIFNEMYYEFGEIAKIQNYSLENIFKSIDDLKLDDKEKILEDLINIQLNKLKNEADEKKIKSNHRMIENILDYYEIYDDIADGIANQLLYKIIGTHEETLDLPVNISDIKKYFFIYNLDNNQLSKALNWILIKLTTIRYCIEFNK